MVLQYCYGYQHFLPFYRLRQWDWLMTKIIIACIRSVLYELNKQRSHLLTFGFGCTFSVISFLHIQHSSQILVTKEAAFTVGQNWTLPNLVICMYDHVAGGFDFNQTMWVTDLISWGNLYMISQKAEHQSQGHEWTVINFKVPDFCKPPHNLLSRFIQT